MKLSEEVARAIEESLVAFDRTPHHVPAQPWPRSGSYHGEFDGLYDPRAMADAAIAIVLERAWSAGWEDCKASLSDDDQTDLTDDVKTDAWADASIRALAEQGEG